MTILLGAIADDFTGATDLCNTLVKEGMRTVQVIGVPDSSTEIGKAEAVVVALKSRTAPVDEAVAQSLAVYDWLRANGAAQVIEKYCSTFDSTRHGNIGPITDALLARAGAQATIVCPAFPENGRTVYQGHLFVWGDLLSDSSMKDHPLTPMRDASLVRLMEAQGKGRAGVVPLQTVRQGPEAIRAAISDLAGNGISYLITDAIERADLRAIGSAIPDHPIVSGGSGIALGLPGNLRRAGKLGQSVSAQGPSVQGRRLVLAGSCSSATRGQIDHVSRIWPTRKINVEAIATGRDVVGTLTEWANAQTSEHPVVIYASADPDEVRANQEKFGGQEAGAMVEEVLGTLAVELTGAGFRQMIVAGGESSGAVVSALGVKALRIGPEIAPGVPWTESLGQNHVALALKSGNFGAETFFEDAFEMLP